MEGFPNGLAFDSNGDMFVTDTIGGGVWKIDSNGTVTTWVVDDLLLGTLPPGPLGFPIGANGVVFDQGENNLYVSVTDKSRIVRIPVGADGSPGTVEVFVEDAANMPGPDGMTLDPSGNIYVALFGGDAVVSVSPSGDISPVLSGARIQNPSNLQFGVGSDSNTLYIANFAAARLLGLVPGTPLPAVLSVVPGVEGGGLTNTVAFQDFGWDPNHTGATGSVTYKPLASSFTATVNVADLKPSHTYNLYIMENDLTGKTGLDSTSYVFTTDEAGAAAINVAKIYEAAEGAPLPAFQVHFLVVDKSVDLTGTLPNPLGVAHPIALACSFPLGFLQLSVPGVTPASLSGDSVPLFNYGWAPGYSGGNGSISYTGQSPTFEATVTVGDLKPDHEYVIFMMSSALNGEKTTTEMTLSTDANGAGSLDISHSFEIPEGLPLPALQVHFLVIDRSEALPDAINPFGIENPIVLACQFPLGFIQM